MEKAGIPAENPLNSEEAVEMIPYLEKEIRKIKKEGRMEGRQEERAKMAVAMSRKGYSMEAIMDLTGFSEEEIHNLLQKAAH